MTVTITHAQNPAEGWDISAVAKADPGEGIARAQIIINGFKEYEMPVSHMSGPHLHLADLPLAVPLDSVQQYQDYIARLHQIPGVFRQTEEILIAGKNDHARIGKCRWIGHRRPGADRRWIVARSRANGAAVQKRSTA